MSELRTDFKDEILQEGETHRVYDIKRKGTDEIVESDIYLEKAYTAMQEGDEFGAKEVNEIHSRLNGLAPQNLLINGDFKIWQRGTTFSDIANQYTADMWRIENAVATVTLVERSTDVPSNADCNYSIHIKDTQSNPNCYLKQKGMNFKGSFVLSFWYKSNKNFPTYYTDGSGTHLLGVNEPSSEWKYVSYKFSSNNLSTLIIILGASNGDFYIASVRLYRGEIDYPHVEEDDAIALMRCLTWVQSLRQLSIRMVLGGSGGQFYFRYPLKTKMRNEPTVIVTQSPSYYDAVSSSRLNIEGASYNVVDKDKLRILFTSNSNSGKDIMIDNLSIIVTCEPL